MCGIFEIDHEMRLAFCCLNLGTEKLVSCETDVYRNESGPQLQKGEMITMPRATITSPKSAQDKMTSDQRRQILRLFEDRLDSIPLMVEGAQRLIMNGGEFQDGVRELIRSLSTPNQFANEEVRSNLTYPKEYKGPKPIEEQIETLSKTLGIDTTSALKFAKSLPKLPDGAEGWFAVPSIDVLAAKLFSEVTDPAEKYCRVVQFMLGKIAESRPFHNWREGQITPDRLRLFPRTVEAFAKVAEE